MLLLVDGGGRRRGREKLLARPPLNLEERESLSVFGTLARRPVTELKLSATS